MKAEPMTQDAAIRAQSAPPTNPQLKWEGPDEEGDYLVSLIGVRNFAGSAHGRTREEALHKLGDALTIAFEYACADCKDKASSLCPEPSTEPPTLESLYCLGAVDSLAQEFVSTRPWTKVHPWLSESLVEFGQLVKERFRATSSRSEAQPRTTTSSDSSCTTLTYVGKPTDWQAIATAPKDRRVLCWYPRAAAAFVSSCEHVDEMAGPGGEAPTHWHELPPPPLGIEAPPTAKDEKA